MMMFFAIFGMINAAIWAAVGILFTIACISLKRIGVKPMDAFKHAYELGYNYADELYDAAED